MQFPGFTLVSASAGSGKTHALAMRYVALLLAADVPSNDPGNILAITFTNNAAAEMRQRILFFLKQMVLGDPELLAQAGAATGLAPVVVRERASEALERIFAQFSDMQVRTIDSFLARVFKAAALELGFSPDFEILLSPASLTEYAFDLYAKDVRENSPQSRELLRLAALIAEGRQASLFLWDPYTVLREGVTDLMDRLASVSRHLVTTVEEAEVRVLEREVQETATRLQRMAADGDLPLTKLFSEDLAILSGGGWRNMLSRKSRMGALTKAGTKTQQAALASRAGEFERDVAALYRLFERLVETEARFRYRPFIEASAQVRDVLEKTKRMTGQLLFEDVNRLLVEYLATGAFPDVYLTLGEHIAHYLIDEFQDTSPLQWAALRPLIENALSTDGSLYVVGDTKQSIYGFRGADWRIMRDLEEGRDSFASVSPEILRLETNRRSAERIVRFTEQLFSGVVGNGGSDAEAAMRSGLDQCRQEVLEKNRNTGHVEVIPVAAGSGDVPERDVILRIVEDARRRGHAYEDLAILLRGNDDVLQVSAWLNGAGIPFLSHSNLDIRARRIIGEVLALLRFLDAPIDSLSFATFLLGAVLQATFRDREGAPTLEALHELAAAHTGKDGPPLYAEFRRRYGTHWDALFDPLFAGVGHMPLYDLVSEVCKTFRVFDLFPGEESALMRLLEVVKDFEQEGENSLKNFLAFADEAPGEDDAAWTIDPPAGGAVTLMTIHKSKGMQFPVLLLALYDRRPQADPRHIHEHDAGVELVYITRPIAKWSQALERIREEREGRRLTDDFNMLYVALTRAKQELYIITVGDPAEKLFPGRVLPPAGATSGERPEALRKRDMNPRRLLHPMHDERRTAAAPVSPFRIGPWATRRGEYMHALLAHLTYVEDPAAEVERAAAETPAPALLLEGAQTSVRTFLAGSGILPLFTKQEGRTVLIEQDCVGPDGALRRMDRVVVDHDTVTVIDFKTGDDAEEGEYREQIREYMRLAGDLYPGRRIAGLLAYVDRNTLRWVS